MKLDKNNLINNIVSDIERFTWNDLAYSLTTFTVDKELAKLCNYVGNGLLSPFGSFLTKEDCNGILTNNRTTNNISFPFNLTFPITKNLFDKLDLGSDLAIFDTDELLVAIITIKQKFQTDFYPYKDFTPFISEDNCYLSGNIMLINPYEFPNDYLGNPHELSFKSDNIAILSESDEKILELSANYPNANFLVLGTSKLKEPSFYKIPSFYNLTKTANMLSSILMAKNLGSKKIVIDIKGNFEELDLSEIDFLNLKHKLE